MKRLQAYAIRNWARDAVDIVFYSKNENGSVDILRNFSVETQAENEAINLWDTNSLSISTKTATEFMDCLWNIGIRPTDLLDRSDVVNAKDRHIEDLRKIMDAFIKKTI